MKNRRVHFVLSLATAVLIVGFIIAPPVWASRGQVLITDVNGVPVDLWKVGDTLYITVIDPDENISSDRIDLIGEEDECFVNEDLRPEGFLGADQPVIELVAPNSGDVENCDISGLILQETGINTGVFRSAAGIRITKATIDEPAEPGDLVPVLEVGDNDTIFVRYQDFSDPTDIDGDLAKLQKTRAIIAITDRAGSPVEIWNVGNEVFVTLTDADENTDPVAVESVTATLVNPRIDPDTGEPVAEPVELTLVETGANTGVFRNVEGVLLTDDRAPVGPTPGLELFVEDKDTIVAFYGLHFDILLDPDIEQAGDPNDRSDFAIDDAKVAEPNPAIISLTDVNGTEKREFRIGEDLFITVKDEDANTDSDRVECIVVRVVNVNGGREGFFDDVVEPPCPEREVEGLPELGGFALYETGVNTGVFRNPNARKIVGVNSPLGQQEWDEEFREFIDDVPGVIAVHNEDFFYVIYGDETAPTLDAFDSDLAIASISDTQVFNVVGGTAVNKIKFTDDAGGPPPLQGRYKVGQDLFVEVEDPDQNEDSDLVELVEVTVLDRNTGDVEVIILEETGPNTGVFRNRDGLPLCRPGDLICWPENFDIARGDGILQMEDRDTLEAHYGAPLTDIEFRESVSLLRVLKELREEDPFATLEEAREEVAFELEEAEAVGAALGDPTNPHDFSAVWLRVIPQPAPLIETPSRTRFTDAAGRTVARYLLGDNVYVTVEDADENRTPGVPDVIRGATTLENLDTGLSMKLDLTETGPDTGVFISAAVSTAPGNELGIEAGHTLKATYIDPISTLPDKSEATIKVEPRVMTIEKFINAPNPFAVTTTFKAVGVGIESVSVKVWDLSGRLVFEDARPGDSITWDGEDLANGAYLYIMSATGVDKKTLTSKVQKLVILR